MSSVTRARWWTPCQSTRSSVLVIVTSVEALVGMTRLPLGAPLAAIRRRFDGSTENSPAAAIRRRFDQCRRLLGTSRSTVAADGGPEPSDVCDGVVPDTLSHDLVKGVVGVHVAHGDEFRPGFDAGVDSFLPAVTIGQVPGIDPQSFDR